MEKGRKGLDGVSLKTLTSLGCLRVRGAAQPWGLAVGVGVYPMC